MVKLSIVTLHMSPFHQLFQVHLTCVFADTDDKYVAFHQTISKSYDVGTQSFTHSHDQESIFQNIRVRDDSELAVKSFVICILSAKLHLENLRQKRPTEATSNKQANKQWSMIAGDC